MRIIPREVKRRKPITWSREIRELQERLKLNSFQKKVLIGTLLGDGCLTPNVYGKNYRLQIAHCDGQREYLLWKYEIFREWTLSEPKFATKTNSWRFRTISHPVFTKFQKLFYRNKKKVLPERINEVLKDPISLAVWFMDDGTRGPKGGLTLNTQNFTRKENEKLMRYLSSNLDLKTSLHRDRKYWRIYIFPSSVPRFHKIIEKFVIPELKYKLLLTP